MISAVCPACRASVPAMDGPIHAYITAAPGCWFLYGELAARAATFPPNPGAVQLRTDAYAAQHAVNPDPRNRQSVAVHLMSLCATFEGDLRPGDTTRLIGRWAHRPQGYPDLISATPRGELTVADAHAAGSYPEYVDAVNRWARSVWTAWAEHHDTIRHLLGEHGLRRGG